MRIHVKVDYFDNETLIPLNRITITSKKLFRSDEKIYVNVGARSWISVLEFHHLMENEADDKDIIDRLEEIRNKAIDFMDKIPLDGTLESVEFFINENSQTKIRWTTIIDDKSVKHNAQQ